MSYRVGTPTNLSANATIMNHSHTPYILSPSHSAAEDYFVHHQKEANISYTPDSCWDLTEGLDDLVSTFLSAAIPHALSGDF